jgi:2-polyprenyl-3-methyl-5-hydroxy-6-metoxy-1,4-benzoquinol methylase
VEYVDHCKLCDDTRIRPQYVLERYGLTVFRCSGCKLRFVGDDLPDAQIAHLYDLPELADYFVALEQRHEHKFTPRLRELPIVGVAAGARILDVGCGIGEFATLAKAAGYDAVGIDVSEPVIRNAQQLHPDVEFVAGDVADLAAAEPESFDLVTLWDVIEHVKYPHRIVAACAELVRPGGLVAFGTPNGSSLYDRTANVAYHTVSPVGKLMLMQRYSQWHLQIWTERTLSRLVRDHGLEVARVRRHRELTGTPSLYLRQQRFNRLANIARHMDGLIEVTLPIRNKLTLYARKPATAPAAGSGDSIPSSSS